MERAKAERLLKKYARFAGLNRDDLRMGNLLDDLVSTCAGVGITAALSGDIDPLAAHQEFNNHLSELCAGRGNFKLTGQSVYFGAPMIIDGGESVFERSKGGSLVEVQPGPPPTVRRAPTIQIDPGGVDGLIFSLYLLMFITDVKKVIKCPGCHRYFFRIKGRRLTCSDRCRKRVSDANRTPKQIAWARKKRQERYKK